MCVMTTSGRIRTRTPRRRGTSVPCRPANSARPWSDQLRGKRAMSIDVDGLAYREWCECRLTIGRLDSILADLRKYRFTLITGPLTASVFLGAGTNRPDAGVAAFIAVMVLVTALFSVDTYYPARLSGALARALDLE